MDDPSPYYHLVPKNFQANLRFRKKLVRMGMEDPAVAAGLLEMCAKDLLFYVNTFVWTYDPRGKGARKLPFITWKYQDVALLEIQEALGSYDLLTEKSRDMGASWQFLIPMEHAWHFVPEVRFGLVSRNEDYVDASNNPKSLFGKVDFIHAHQPAWLLPSGRELGSKDPGRIKCNLLNADNGSTMSGETTTGDIFRGDRLTAVLLDEFAAFEAKDGFKALSATRDATPCRFINSTPKGLGNAFYRMAKKPEIKKLRMHWSDHPIKRRGLYKRGDDGELRIIDRDYWAKRLLAKGIEFDPQRLEAASQEHLPFEFVLDDPDLPLRSPWFDVEVTRCESVTEVYQELEIRYDASNSPFFVQRELDKHVKEYTRRPLHRGVLDFLSEDLRPTEFAEREGGPLELWFRLDATGQPPSDRDYVIGVDVATGTRGADGLGSSNSVLTVGDRTTREVVAQYTVNGMNPSDFAERAIVLGRWFRGPRGAAKVIWEANGPGGTFGDRLIEKNYQRIYYRRAESSVLKKPTTSPGWFSTTTTKMSLLSEFRRAMASCEFVIRSEATLRECEAYEYTTSGGVVHSGAVTQTDPSGARDNHGDRVISAALCWWELRGKGPSKEQEQKVPPGSFMARREAAKASAKGPDNWWDTD